MADEPPEYVLFEYAFTSLDRPAADNPKQLLAVAQNAAEQVRPPITVFDGARHLPFGSPATDQPPDDIFSAMQETIRRATGAIVLLSYASIGLGMDLGAMTQGAVPVLTLAREHESVSSALSSIPNVTHLVYSESADYGYADLEAGIRRWIEQLPRRRAVTNSADAIAAGELGALEVFLTAFYQQLHDGTIALNEPDLLTVKIHIDTINLQLRAPEPNRHVVKATLKAIGVVLLGVGSGAGGNYLYSLLPHFH